MQNAIFQESAHGEMHDAKVGANPKNAKPVG
jgi:hypothetical protein